MKLSTQLIRLGAFLCLMVLPIPSIQAYTCPAYTDTFTDTIVVNAFPSALQPYADKIPGASKAQQADKLSQTKKALWVVEVSISLHKYVLQDCGQQ